MHLNKHFLFIIGAPALLVLLASGAGMYRLSSIKEESEVSSQNVTEHIVQEEGMSPQDTARVAMVPRNDRASAPSQQAPATEDMGTHFSGTLEKVDTGCFSDGECFVVVDGKHVTAVRGWSQEVVGTVQGVDGFGDLAWHIGAQVEVFAYGAGDGVYTLYGNDKLYIRLATSSMPTPQTATSTHMRSQGERPQVQ